MKKRLSVVNTVCISDRNSAAKAVYVHINIRTADFRVIKRPTVTDVSRKRSGVLPGLGQYHNRVLSKTTGARSFQNIPLEPLLPKD